MITRVENTLPGGGAPRPLRFAMALFAAAGMCLAAPPETHAEPKSGIKAPKREVMVSINAPRQGVVIGGVAVDFEARMEFCADHHRGFGFVTFGSETDSAETVHLYPFWGSVDKETGAIILFLCVGPDGPAEPRDIITMVVQDSADEDCDIYDMIGPGVIGGVSLEGPFDAVSRITRSVYRGDCEPIDFGQIDAPVSVRVPLQRVEPPPAPSEITGFGAKLFLDREQQARGSLEIITSDERQTYEAFFGAAFRTASGEVEVFVFSLLDTRRAFLSANDHAMRATGGTTASQPGCLIWDLVNGSTGLVDGVFDAEGTLRVRLPQRDR